ncbi:MAG: hypothetical protein GY928_17575, partial [Colwellia sp.]|nr:hypothetical protein [Colwellia sp.]
METQFTNLIQEWKQKPGSNGGQLAIRGFDFQLILTINSLLEHAKSRTLSHAEAESLSDFTVLTDSKIIITLAKYTLDSGGFSKALHELWCIHKLIQSSFKELLNKVNYCIVGKQQSLKDLPGAIERFEPKMDYIQEDLTTFKTLIETEVHPNPHIILAHRLISEFGIEDPFKRIHLWLGQLFTAIDNGNSSTICAEIISILHGLHIHKNRGKPLLLWSKNDKAPDQVIFEPDPNKAVVLGEVPVKQHLRDGRFTERSLYKKIFLDFSMWLGEAQVQARDRIPVYWLAGRSGCGKSVALLHLLSNIKQQDAAATIIWCERNPKRLEQANAWISDLLQENENLFIAFDDPFIFNQQDAMETQLEGLSIQLEQIKEENSLSKVPFLICCGPDEQLQWFEERCNNYVDVRSFRLAPESEDDHKELRDWYQIRTGKSLPIDDGSRQEQLLVQTLFQWHTGSSLKCFAQRFKNRLNDKRWKTKNKNPFDLVSEILAVNRLYANYPEQNYEYYCNQDSKLGNAMDILCEEDQHFSIKPEQGGIRFTHPQLANELYQEWYPSNKNKRERRYHLEQWIKQTQLEHSAVSDKLEPLWVISKLSNPYVSNIGSERIVLIREDLQNCLPKIYTAFTSEPALNYLPVWSNLNYNLELNLKPSPITLIVGLVKAVNHTEPGFRLACHKLIEFNEILSEEEQHLVPTIINSDLNWPGWHEVLEDYILKVGAHRVKKTLFDYIDQNHNRRDVETMIKKACFKIEERNLSLHHFILQWLLVSPLANETWSNIYSLFVRQCQEPLPKDLLKRAKHIIKSQPENSNWSIIWESLFKQLPSNELISLAVDWLKKPSSNELGWNYVWQALWSISTTAEKSKSLEVMAIQWLDTVSVEHGSWTFVWEELSKSALSAEVRNTLEIKGLQWLNTVWVEHASWTFVWEELSKSALSAEVRNTLEIKGLQWLNT